MNRQRGVTFIGMIFIAAAIVIVAIIGLKLIPPYIEYATIQSNLRELAHAPDTRGASPADIRQLFNRRAQIDDIRAISGQDVDVEQQENGVLLTAKYSVRVPLVGNVSACIDFNVSSE